MNFKFFIIFILFFFSSMVMLAQLLEVTFVRLLPYGLSEIMGMKDSTLLLMTNQRTEYYFTNCILNYRPE